MALRLHLDFETRSELDVRKVGASKYASHPSTEIMSLAFALEDEPVELLTEENLSSSKLKGYVARANQGKIRFGAHNAGFEQAIWRYLMARIHGYDPIAPKHWYCTAAKAARAALPRALGACGEELELAVQKDKEGNKAMLSLSKPRSRLSKTNKDRFWRPHTAPEKFKQLYAYNINDVDAERAIDVTLPDLEPEEQEIWVLDQEMNQRGMRLDREAILGAIRLLKQDKAEALKRFQTATGLNSPKQLEKFKAWLTEHGFDLPNLQGETVASTLENDGLLYTLPPEVKTALQEARYLGRTSTAKYDKMLEMLGDDDRIRDYLIYCGAERTRRWTGAGFQPQNFIRMPKHFPLTQVIADIKQCDYDLFSLLYPNIIDTIALAIRGMIIPTEGHDMYIADFSGIESRVLAWLAGQEDLIELFWELDWGLRDNDNYCELASSFLGRLITKADDDERQMGKVAELFLGYNGGINAFVGAAVGYKINLELLAKVVLPTARRKELKLAKKAYNYYKKKAKKPVGKRVAMAVDVIKQRYRRKRKQIVQLWSDMHHASIAATRNKGQAFPVTDKVYFIRKGDYLRMYLPSGGYLSYRRPRIKSKKNDWGTYDDVLTYLGRKDGIYKRLETYGGKLTENAVQAIARDLMAAAFVRVRKAGYHPLFLVHDEAVSEAPKGFNDIHHYNQIMREKPDWAKTIPIDVSGAITDRYRKV